MLGEVEMVEATEHLLSRIGNGSHLLKHIVCSSRCGAPLVADSWGCGLQRKNVI